LVKRGIPKGLPFFFKLKERFFGGGENIGHVYFDCLSFAAQNIEGRNISCPIFSSSGSSSSQKTQKEGKLSPFSGRGSIRAATKLLLLFLFTLCRKFVAESLYLYLLHCVYAPAWLLNLFTYTYYIAFMQKRGAESLY